MANFCECGCGQRIVGRSTKKYSSNACRQRAHYNREKKREESMLQQFTFDEHEISCDIERIVGNGHTMQMFGQFLQKIPRNKWIDALHVVHALTAVACERGEASYKNQIPF